MSDYKVIYLTGAPASGKSSLTRELLQQVDQLQVFEYGSELTKHIASKSQETALQQDDLRSRSASIITPQDVLEVDRILINMVEEKRGSTHFVIDSHAVTKEEYGFRVIGFSLDQLRALHPDFIVSLQVDPETTMLRIQKDPMGRPTPTDVQATIHTLMQHSVAATYATILGIPFYILDADKPISEVAHVVVGIMASS